MGDSGDGLGPLHKADDITHLRRFMCLGSELGRCGVEDKKLTVDNARCIMRLIEAGRGEEVVQEIVKYSTDGRVAKQKPLLFALAICARLTNGDKNDVNHYPTKRAAYAAVGKVCRIPTDLFTFVKLSEGLTKSSGWGRAFRRAVKQWYESKDGRHLAYLITKYVSREKWSHHDLLRLSHMKIEKPDINVVLKYISKGLKATQEAYAEDEREEIQQLLQYLTAVDTVKHTKDEHQAACLIREHQLVREHVPTWLNGSAEVWTALLDNMPITALLKNLGKLSSLKVLDVMSNQSEIVVQRLTDTEALKKAKIHPFHVLTSLNAYQRCKSEHKDMTWKTNSDIVSALSQAFHSCFQIIEPTNKRFLLALDVTTSMKYGQVSGNRQISPAKAAATMAMVTLRSEPVCDVINFATEVKPVKLKPEMDLDQVMKLIAEMPKGGADCAIPMQWALSHAREYDVIIIYTDLEPYAGEHSPADMIINYRRDMNLPNAKLVICALTSKGFSLADPEDKHMLDIAGLDSETPHIIHQFVSDQIQ